MADDDKPDIGAETDNTLDFSTEPFKEDIGISQYKIGDDYDPRPQEDAARRNIAYLLIGLLWVLVSGILVLVAFKSITLQDIKEFAVILGPVVTLVSAATGFYYGTKNNNT